MFRWTVIAKTLTCLAVLTACGYHSVNQPPTGACEMVTKVKLDNRLNRPGFETKVQRLVQRYFQTDADLVRGLELRVRINPVSTRLTGFTEKGLLGAKVFEVQSQVDVLTSEQMLWSVHSRATSSVIAHRSDPMWSSAAEDVGLLESLEKSIAELHIRFETKCRRKLFEKEAL